MHETFINFIRFKHTFIHSVQKETYKLHIDITIYKKKYICEYMILLKSEGLSGIIHVEKARFIDQTKLKFIEQFD